MRGELPVAVDHVIVAKNIERGQGRGAGERVAAVRAAQAAHCAGEINEERRRQQESWCLKQAI